MTPDTVPWMYGLGTVVMLATLVSSRFGSRWWLLDPRFAAALVVWVNAFGQVISDDLYGRPAPVFGLVESYIPDATLALLLGQLGFTLALFIPTDAPRRAMPNLELLAPAAGWLAAILAGAVLFTGGIAWWSLVRGGLSAVLSSRYGADQFSSTNPIVGLSYIAVPSAVTLVLHWGQLGRGLTSPWLVAICSYAVWPSFLTGGRRDLLMLAAAFAIVGYSRAGRRRVWAILLSAGLIFSLSFLTQASRSGTSMDPSERLARTLEAVGSEDLGVVGHSLTAFSGTAVMSASMSVYPSEGAFAYGRTYVESAANVLAPRFITGRYLFVTPSNQFRELFYPTVTGFGFDYSLAAEGYQNFSFVGPFLAYFAAGLLLSATFQLARVLRERTSLWPLLHLQTTLAVLWGIRTDSNTLLKLLVYGDLWLLLLGGLASVAAIRSLQVTRASYTPGQAVTRP